MENNQILFILGVVILIVGICYVIFIQKKNRLITNIIIIQRNYYKYNEIIEKNDYDFVYEIAQKLYISCDKVEKLINCSRKDLNKKNIKVLKELAQFSLHDELLNLDIYYEEIRKKIIEKTLLKGLTNSKNKDFKKVAIRNSNYFLNDAELLKFKEDMIELATNKIAIITDSQNTIQLVCFYIDENLNLESHLVVNSINQMKKIKFANWVNA